ncbi:decaheme cytochrome c MtrF [Halorhodospira halochloris]|uniref:Decaheme cytochrome c MtrF n=1 Tax=Halorhodospira halochloris TaxID=1052 RepID=A0A120MZ85_HALHR|nr:OmcA/MtrC family decaheme c-type cytochrome [Halorhodospira halochloris]MBK1650892.1 hypothetical protein [Halorhodospira halochloris]BAU56606.1 decaheme cytochrome c MtrF [Halorhodospira halochloris]
MKMINTSDWQIGNGTFPQKAVSSGVRGPVSSPGDVGRADWAIGSKQRPLSSLIIAIGLAMLSLAGCDEADDEHEAAWTEDAETSFHQNEWASIQNLDPLGETCIDCHGEHEWQDIGDPEVHNVGLAGNDSPADLGVEGLAIDTVDVDVDGEDGITITAQLNQALPSDASVSATFARLAPRVREDDENQYGHDWQSYFNEVGPSPRDDLGDPLIDHPPRPQPADGEHVSINGNEVVIEIDDEVIEDDDDNTLNEWGEHDFDVSLDGSDDAEYEIKGFSSEVPDLSDHIECSEADYDDSQIDPNGNNGDKPVCWWPDGTALPAGVFVSDDNELIVAYKEEQTHRLALQVNGDPGHNVWYDFVPAGDEGNYSHVMADGRVDAEQYDPADTDHTAPAAREIVDTASCNSCHDQISAHGGNRSEVQMCVTCHNPGNLDAASGRSLDLKQLAHRIHRGSDLPSAGVDGFIPDEATDWTSVNFPQGPSSGDSEGVANCVKCHMGEESYSALSDLATELGPGNGADDLERLFLAERTPQGDNWHDVVSIEACHSCHDDRYWHKDDDGDPAYRIYGDGYLDLDDKEEWLTAHGPGTDESSESCAGGCHTPAGWDSSDLGDGGNNDIDRAHLMLIRQSLIADRFEVEINRAEVDEDGFEAEVAIRDRNTGNLLVHDDEVGELGDDDLDLSDVSIFFGWMADGSPDYNHSSGDARQPAAPTETVDLIEGSNQGGNYTVSLPWSEITRTDWDDFNSPQSSTATVVVEGTIESDDESTVRLPSAAADFAFTGNGELLADDDGRRQVVDFDRVANSDPLLGDESAGHGGVQGCRSCHMQLSYHGENRTNNPQVCVTCHNPQMTDVAYRPAIGTDLLQGPPPGREEVVELDMDPSVYTDGKYEEAMDFKRLIHAVHASGRDGSGYREESFKGRATTRDNTNYPGFVSNCLSCHVEGLDGGTYMLENLPADLIGSTALTGDWGGDHGTIGDAEIDDLSVHRKMSPISSVCTSCHDGVINRAGGPPFDGVTVGEHIWYRGGVAPGVAPPGQAYSNFNLNNEIEEE